MILILVNYTCLLGLYTETSTVWFFCIKLNKIVNMFAILWHFQAKQWQNCRVFIYIHKKSFPAIREPTDFGPVHNEASIIITT